MFYLLDPEKWERQKHFEYYMQMIPCGYTVTVRLDVENLYQQVKKCGLKFYPAFIYCTGNFINVGEVVRFYFGWIFAREINKMDFHNTCCYYNHRFFSLKNEL